jgi:HK97 family phage major capsid protein
MFHNLTTFGVIALAVFALLAVWLAVELPGAAKPRRAVKRLGYRFAIGCLSVALIPLSVDPGLHAIVHASGQGREGIAKRTARKVSGGSIRLRGAFRAFRSVGLDGLFAALRNPLTAKMFVFPFAGADGDDDDTLGDGDLATMKAVGEQVDKLRGDLVKRLGEMDIKGEDKAEVEKREKELGEKVDELVAFSKKRESTEMADFKAELDERIEKFEKQVKDYFDQPASGPRGAGLKRGKELERWEGDNLFLEMRDAIKTHDQELSSRLHDYEEKFNSPERQKAWATEDLEDVDLILPDIQQALPFLRAQAKVVQLFREIRTSSPAVEFPVFKSGLSVGHVDEGEPKPESDPTFDLEVARVFTIAGISDVPNPTLEDFPAARGWISTELGTVTGVQEENDVLSGSGTGEPLGILKNEDIPTRKVDEAAKASAGRNFITSIFRAAQQVRVEGHMEPTDGALNPATWTDIALSFEDAIGFLYGPMQTEGTSDSGPPLGQAPPRILGLPITWSSYIPLDAGEEEDESPIIVGNFMDGIVLRRSPFRIDIDTSIGFKKNLTSFRGEERMGFIVVRPKSFVTVTGVKPTPVV